MELLNAANLPSRSVLDLAFGYPGLNAGGRKRAIVGKSMGPSVLMRTALAKNTASATALFSSILALSSLHRYDIHSQAVEHKISAIKALAAASSNPPMDIIEAMQHSANVENDADLAALLYWVYYHDVLARFGARHWHRNPKGRPSASSDVEAVTGSLRAKHRPLWIS
ncbi:uncharacterized protein P884DRAFT_267962 [Thermothelomyces heterothallicus CBS 202.75]|uniref:uncharacterized protein n=1 Tax=Thermothelomyces heterothallicus CBS 202.75 TaxID=1149848 RepID=UPI00374331CD